MAHANTSISKAFRASPRVSLRFLCVSQLSLRFLALRSVAEDFSVSWRTLVFPSASFADASVVAMFCRFLCFDAEYDGAGENNHERGHPVRPRHLKHAGRAPCTQEVKFQSHVAPATLVAPGAQGPPGKNIYKNVCFYRYRYLLHWASGT